MVRFRWAHLAERIGHIQLVDGLVRRRQERRAARLNPGRGGFIAMAVVVAAGCWVLAARPHRVALPAATAALPATSAPAIAAGGSLASPLSSPSSAGAGGGLVVDVVGKVRHPGVYRLPTGARVDDAVAAAGGALTGVDPVTVNLARKLTDGEQLVIGLASAGAGQPPAASGAADGGSGQVDLNSATVTQLDALPGVGPVLAQRIVDWRTQHGKFDTVDQLQSVSGIGVAKYGDLKSLVTVG